MKAQATLSMAPTTWSVVGTGDFAGTGKGGILWRDTAGNTAIWLMDGPRIASSGSLGNVPTTWSVAGTGDFDGDGNCDILWRDTSGNVAIWFMKAPGQRVQRRRQCAARCFPSSEPATSMAMAVPISSGAIPPVISRSGS